jgi:hypothetical protein
VALIIENGTGVAGADSFNTVDECSAHATAYFGASLNGSNAAKESALRRAFVAMSAFDWLPALWPVFGGEIPEAVKIAQSVLARAEFQSVGALSPSVTTGPRKLLTGAGEVSWTLVPGVNDVASQRPVVTMAMDLLRPYLATNPAEAGGRTRFVERA